MKSILSICSLSVLLALSSCRSCPPKEESCTCKTCASFGPTPGFNTTVSVTPTSPSQPAVWVAWNLNGNQTGSGSNTTHSVWIGSEDEDFLVGGFAAIQGTTYQLKVTGLQETSVAVTVINTSTGAETPISSGNVYSIDGTSEAFAVSVHDNPNNSATFLLIVTGPNGGLKLILS